MSTALQSQKKVLGRAFHHNKTVVEKTGGEKTQSLVMGHHQLPLLCQTVWL